MTDDAPDTGTDANDDTQQQDDNKGDTPTVESLTAEVDKWKAQSRKHEDRAKANGTAAKELEALKAATMSDQEKAVELARTQARAEALMEVAAERVEDAVKLAAAPLGIDVEALLDGLDRTRFVTEEGKPDTAAITAWVERIAPKPAEGFAGDIGQGARGGNSNIPLGSDPLLNTLKQSIGIR